MREALLFVIVVAMLRPACGCSWPDCFAKTNQHLVRCQWRLADRFGWRPVVEDFVAPCLGFEEG